MDTQGTELLERLKRAVMEERMVEFRFHGLQYVIQIENNKGWDYISIWRISGSAVCLGRALFEIWDGIDEETVQELFSQPCIEGENMNQLADRLEHIHII